MVPTTGTPFTVTPPNEMLPLVIGTEAAGPSSNCKVGVRALAPPLNSASALHASQDSVKGTRPHVGAPQFGFSCLPSSPIGSWQFPIAQTDAGPT